MEKENILKLNNLLKNYNNLDNLDQIKKDLEKKYIISCGSYDNFEIKKIISEKNPVIIKNHFLIGYNENNKFVDINDNEIPIERMVKAIIVESENDAEENIPSALDLKPADPVNSDPFAIIGRNEWDEISQFMTIIGKLRVGQIFLPPHSAIFNFLDPSKQIEKNKIVSELDGVNINIYSQDNYIDNAIHEIGHLFWRDCVKFGEKQAFKDMFKTLKPSAIYVFEWERNTEEEVFCTVYKWYVKSLLLNPAFYNILEFEEPKGLQLLQGILSRLARDRQIEDIWNLSKKEVFDYINPKFDSANNRYLRKAGMLNQIKDIEIPANLLNNIVKYENGIEYIRLEKAVVPVKNNQIVWELIK